MHTQPYLLRLTPPGAGVGRKAESQPPTTSYCGASSFTSATLHGYISSTMGNNLPFLRVRARHGVSVRSDFQAQGGAPTMPCCFRSPPSPYGHVHCVELGSCPPLAPLSKAALTDVRELYHPSGSPH